MTLSSLCPVIGVCVSSSLTFFFAVDAVVVVIVVVALVAFVAFL